MLSVTAGGVATLLSGCLNVASDPESGVSTGGDTSPTATETTGDADPAPTDGRGDSGDGTSTREETSTGTDEAPDDSGDGSTGRESPEETDESTAEGTDEPTPTESETSGSDGIVGRSFEVTEASCGTGDQQAAVDRDADRVVVDGTIGGRNGCYTAELDRASYDERTDELTVAIRSVAGGDGGPCLQCIVDVDYRAAVELAGDAPGTVRVFHDGSRVRTD